MGRIAKHSISLPLAALLLFVLAFTSAKESEAELIHRPSAETVTFAVNHQSPAELTLQTTQKLGATLLRFSVDGSTDIELNAPLHWKRGEVQNVSLQDVSLGIPSFGYQRFALPAGSSITFTSPDAIETLLLHHLSEEMLKVTIVQTDLEETTSSKDIFLVKQSLVTLWEHEL